MPQGPIKLERKLIKGNRIVRGDEMETEKKR